MRVELMALRTGEITFDQFARATAVHWRRLADYLLRRWACPDAVERVDVEQELLLAAFQAVGRWDPERGVSIQRYVVFQAVSSAKGWVHVQRSAGKRGDCAPSRHPIVFSRFGDTPLPESSAFGSQSTPDCDTVVLANEVRARALAGARTWREQLCLTALLRNGGSIDAAADEVYGDPALRRACRFDCRRDASRAIRRAAERAVEGKYGS